MLAGRCFLASLVADLQRLSGMRDPCLRRRRHACRRRRTFSISAETVCVTVGFLDLIGCLLLALSCTDSRTISKLFRASHAGLPEAHQRRGPLKSAERNDEATLPICIKPPSFSTLL